VGPGSDRGADRFEERALLAQERARLIRDAVRMDTGFERWAPAGLASPEAAVPQERDTGT
jgi:hypothetical protein